MIDTVTYSVGPISELAGTQNEMDRYLRRTVKYPGVGDDAGQRRRRHVFSGCAISPRRYDTLDTPVIAI